MSNSLEESIQSLISQSLEADNLDEDQFCVILDKFCSHYHNGYAIISDDKYDALKDLYEKKFGKEYNKVGAPICGSQQKKTLPKYMGSMNKITDKKALQIWKKKNSGPYVITDKIDGVSALRYKKDLYTRGDGTVGTDISHLLSIINIPKKTDGNDGMVRMEIVMPKSTFEKKYNSETANARNMVSGLINRKHSDPKIVKDLLLLAYEYDDGSEIKQSDQLSKLKNLGYNLPFNEIIYKDDDLTVEYLQDLLKKRKELADYDIDGLVIVRDNPCRPVPGENPKNAFAFKMEGECAKTKVIEVEWNTSKHGLLKPRIRIEPVQLCGVTITWCTGFNAKFIQDNNICKGCTIEVTRRGDVIPYCKDIPIPGDHADMPDQEYEWTKKKYMATEEELKEYGRNVDDIDLEIELHGKEKYYIWYSDSEVDICIKNENDDMRIKKLISFFKKLEAKFVGESSIQKLYYGGYATLHDIFNLTVDDICKIEGFQKKSAIRLIEAIKNSITNVPLSKIAAASGVMGIGIGEKKIQFVVDKHPNILELDIPVSEMTELVKEVGGFNTLAVHFASKIPLLKKFFVDHPQITLKEKKKKMAPIVFEDDEDEEKEEYEHDEDNRGKELKGKTVVFTGFRNKDAEERIKECGGKVTTTVSGKTNLLVVAKRFSSNSKEIKADQLGIEVITGEEFMKRYM